MSKRIEELERRVKELEEKIQLNDSHRDGKKVNIDNSLIRESRVIMIKEGCDKQKVVYGTKELEEKFFLERVKDALNGMFKNNSLDTSNNGMFKNNSLDTSNNGDIKNHGKKEKIDMSLVKPAGVIMIKDGSDKQKIFKGNKYGE